MGIGLVSVICLRFFGGAACTWIGCVGKGAWKTVAASGEGVGKDARCSGSADAHGRVVGLRKSGHSNHLAFFLLN